jgi:adenosylcobinamide-GDP ribazoletransferase
MKHSAIRHPLKSLMAAIRFLTILPLPGSGENDTSFFGAALFYFPITGLIIGSFSALCAFFLVNTLPIGVAAVLLTIFLSLASGFLHLDGLADSCDGLLSARPAPKCLEIMRDSRIGVMGAAALSAVFLLKTASIAAFDPANIYYALIIAPVAGRTSIIFMMALLPYARKNEGLGLLFYSANNRWAAFFSALFFITVTVVLIPSKLIMLSLTLVVSVAVFSWVCRKKIGGATGDTLGAVCEITETMVLIAFCTNL